MKNFNKEKFMEYLKNNFNDFENGFLCDTVENIIEYAFQNYGHSLDTPAYFISDMLPEIEFSEVAMFCDDAILTRNGQRAKGEMLNRNGAKK